MCIWTLLFWICSVVQSPKIFLEMGGMKLHIKKICPAGMCLKMVKKLLMKNTLKKKQFIIQHPIDNALSHSLTKKKNELWYEYIQKLDVDK